MKLTITILIALGCLLVACSQESNPVTDPASLGAEAFAVPAMAYAKQYTPPPVDLVTVTDGSSSLELWPYIGVNFSGTPQDPINLIFVGQADPRDIRAALLSLDGDRTALGLPDEFPFNCRWTDAIGDMETAYSTPGGWRGSVIQLACGDYNSMRFHLRLFRAGEWTIANVHLDVLIPGTSEHEVISWEVPEQFVIGDFMRSGLLDPNLPMVPTQQINASPFRTIRAAVYNGLPPEIRALIGGPASNVTEDVPVWSDGHATILNLADRVPWQGGDYDEAFTSVFDQYLPKPFCADGEMDWVYVTGAVDLTQHTRLDDTGEFSLTFRAAGELMVTPINPLTGQPTGPTTRAIIREHHDGVLNDRVDIGSSLIHQILLPSDGGDIQRHIIRLHVGSGGGNSYHLLDQCGGGDPAELEPVLPTAALGRGVYDMGGPRQ